MEKVPYPSLVIHFFSPPLKFQPSYKLHLDIPKSPRFPDDVRAYACMCVARNFSSAPSAHGFIKTLGATLIQATFTIDQIPHNYVGTINPSVPQFISTDEILTYDSILSLTGTKVFYGKLGTTDVKLATGGGAAGTLATPISPAIDVDCTATWTGDKYVCQL
ncbi:hypothetical protein BDZ94DRAFT_1276268 [Collybia nuda]|uniref:Uncharacterized protein n=1 Tax=Collybia nuda TaxID=64659 RepID=A0A9P6CCP0_9AGAR|nr:hypothetical protein BDZ94DRAFT_1276268 [Collybia nuda]